MSNFTECFGQTIFKYYEDINTLFKYMIHNNSVHRYVSIVYRVNTKETHKISILNRLIKKTERLLESVLIQ